MSANSKAIKTIDRDSAQAWAEEYAKLNTDIGGIINSGTSIGGNSTTAQLRTYLNSPLDNYTMIADEMRAAYARDGIIRNIVNYYVSMLTYNHTIYPIANAKNDFNMPTDQVEFLTAAQHLKRYQLKLYAPYFVKEALIQGIAFFYEIQNNTGVVYMEFPLSMCIIAGIEDGVYRWAIDIGAVTDEMIELPNFPREITNAYEQGYQEGNNRWLDENYFIISNKGFAVTLDMSAVKNGGIAVSSLSSLLIDESEMQTAKQNVETKDNIDTARFLHAKIPMDKDGKIQMTAKEAASFYQVISKVLPDGVAAAATPMELTAVPLSGVGTGKAYETLQDAQEKLFLNAGVPGVLFGKDSKSSVVVNISIQKDANWMFSTVIPMLEAYYNSVLNKVKTESGALWTISILEQDRYSSKDYIAQKKEMVTFGGSRTDYLASLGLEPIEIVSKLNMEQNMLDIDELMVPKQMSYTMSETSEDTGRTTTDEPTEDTERLRDSR